MGARDLLCSPGEGNPCYVECSRLICGAAAPPAGQETGKREYRDPVGPRLDARDAGRKLDQVELERL